MQQTEKIDDSFQVPASDRPSSVKLFASQLKLKNQISAD